MFRLLLPLLLLATTTLAQTPQPQLLKRIPPPGIALTTAERAELTAGVAALGKDLTALEAELKDKPSLLALLPDVLIFHKAVDWALRYDEFFTTGHIAQARQQVEMGRTRAAELRAGKPSWNAVSGADTKPTPDGKDQLPAMVVSAYRSKIDGSIQPYGIILPEDYRPGENKPRPLHFWAHGRGEKLSELDFINQRLTSKGEFTPPGAFVLHLYGRYCCANKFAGEVDLFEALADAKKHYPIDNARLVMRGFSMGGAAVWQFGTHFAGMWAAVQPGAGFAESKEFLKLGLTPDKPLPSEWEQKLWRWYDSTLYVSNLKNTTTVAYSGEIDGQKQACDIIIRSARQEAGNASLPGRVGVPPAGSGVPPERTSPPAGNSATTTGASPQVREGGTPSPAGGTPTLPGTSAPVTAVTTVAPGDGSPKAEEARVAGTAPDLALYHVTAPNVPHKISPEAKVEIEKLVGPAVEKGRDVEPRNIHLTTYSLIYSSMSSLTIGGMERSWERADVDAELIGNKLKVRTKNVTSLLYFPPEKVARVSAVEIDGKELATAPIGLVLLAKKDGQWTLLPNTEALRPKSALAKIPGLCGPIDHAFMDSFVFVRPTGKQLNKVVGDWVEGELGRAVTQWRAVFRGDARVVADTALTEDDIKNSNLVLWGDPSSNAILKRLLATAPPKAGGVEGTAPSVPRISGHGSDGALPSSTLASILKWDSKQLVFGGKTYDAAHTAPVLIFPNPLNPQKYVVLNSGFTFREAHALNNAQQTPKLPDWAIIDLRTAPDAYQPGKIVRAGFFDEQWQPPTAP